MKRTLFLLVLTALLLTGCASVSPPPVAGPLIVLEEEPDGSHWRATWHLDEPTRELLFERRAAGFRPSVFEILTPGFTFDQRGDRDVLRTEGSAVRMISVRFSEYTEWLEKEYEFFQTFSDGSVAVYTGHLVARPIDDESPEECEECFIRSFRFVAPGTPIVVDGRVEQSPVDWVDEQEQGSYVYFGSIDPVASPEMISIVDPALPDWLENETKQALPELFEMYTRRFGVALPERPMILFSYDDTGRPGTSSGGGTLPGQIQLTVNGTGWNERSEEAKLHLFHFLAHEAVHLWNGQVVNYPGSADSWMHEGSADALAQRTLLDLGLIDDERFLGYQTSALNECLRGLDGSALRDAEDRSAFHLYYTCGNMLALLTEQSMAESDLFRFWHVLIERTLAAGEYGVEDYLTIWRQLGADSGTIESLREIVESGADSERLVEVLRRAGVTIVADDDPPPSYGQSVAGEGFLLLMKSDCSGRYGFDRGPDGFILSESLDCALLPSGGVVRSIERHDVVRQGHLVWDSIRECCERGESVDVDVLVGKEQKTVTLPCNASLPARTPYLSIADRRSSTADSGSADDREAIAAQSRRLSEAYVRGDIESLVSIYTEDGVAIPGERDASRGKEELIRLWSLPPGRTVLRHEAKPVTMEIDGDLAWDWGYYEGQAAQDGTPLDPFRGIYTIVWRRGEDGVWRMVVDMWHGLRDE